MSNDPTRILDAARGGRAMVWVLAIMLFLTVLAAALGVGTARAASALGASLAGRATVVIATADPAVRARQASAAAAALRALPDVTRVAPVSPRELATLLGPWLGEAGSDPDLPIPALIDVDVADPAATPRIERALAGVAPGARLDRHGDALSGVTALLTTLTLLAVGLVALMLAATAAVVVLAARAGLDAHRGTIDVMHGLGATDVQVARLFQRRIARDAALGACVGGVAGWLVVAGLGMQASGSGSQLLGGITLGQTGWGAVIALPFAFVALAALVARRAIMRTMGRQL